ncbi:MAG: ribosylglycohydrolase [Desulfobulbaceae bacterium A2]|nr:MAG: ribosylglycohydrolase [Desulfobulbaceae bacterium A2]
MSGDCWEGGESEASYQLLRARGCLLGQLAGDSLGSLVEFSSPDKILARYPDGLRDLMDGGTWDTIAGQPTDDSELALALARMLVMQGEYNPETARTAYKQWYKTNPFDCGNTIRSALLGAPDTDSQANGAMMRVSPLGIFGARHALDQVASWARQDAALTHPHPVCQQANALYVMAIAYAIAAGPSPIELHLRICEWTRKIGACPELSNVVESAPTTPPSNYMRHSGWVLIAFHNALWQLLHAPSFEEGVIDTVAHGGDTDTNAAICGALLGAVYGIDAVPLRWRQPILQCRPKAGNPMVHRPRPECFWPGDALALAAELFCGQGSLPA